jgi:uncharacterized protein (TIGR03437 family)
MSPNIKAMSIVRILLGVLCATCVSAQVITTVAGTDFVFPNSVASLSAPLGHILSVATDATGNVYAADRDNQLVVKISPNGTLTVVAGNPLSGSPDDGVPATGASLGQPQQVAVDAAGNIYFSDVGRIREISNGIVTTIAGVYGSAGYSGDGGPATSALISQYNLNGIVVDAAGAVYIAEGDNCRIRKIAGGIITTIVGNGQCSFSGDGGPAVTATINNPGALAIDPNGNLYIADDGNSRIRKVSGGNITTVAGGTNNSQMYSFAQITGISLDSGGNIYVAVASDNRIYKVSGGNLVPFAGNSQMGLSGDGGPALSASLNDPFGIAFDALGNLYIADFGNTRIRRVTATGIMGPVAGNGGFKYSGDGGPATSAVFNGPPGVAVDAAGNLYIADAANHRIRKVSNGIVTTIAGNGVPAFAGDGGAATNASLNFPVAVAVDSAGAVYISDTYNNVVRKVTGGTITTVAGTGNGGFSGDGGAATFATLSNPDGITVDATGNLYIADGGNARIRKVTNGTITTFAGNGMQGFSGDGGPATSASLQINTNYFVGLVVDATGNLYIADAGNSRVREVSGGSGGNGFITTIAGNGQPDFSGDSGPATSAGLSPGGLALDQNGNLYIGDAGNNRVRKVSNGTITTVAGDGSYAFSGDGGQATAAGVNDPYGVAFDSAGNLFIAETADSRIREVLKTAPSFQVSPTTFNISAIAGGASPAAKVATLTATTTGLPYTTFASTNWLSVNPPLGSTPASLQIIVDPSQLTAGPYLGTVSISAPNAVPSTQTLTVHLTVGPPVASGLLLSSQTVSFAVTQGASPQTSQLTVSNQGSGTARFTATSTTASGGNWLQVSPASGTVTAATPALLNITADPGSLAAGTYSGTVLVASTDTGQNLAIPVTLAISPPLPEILLSQSGLTFTAVAQGGTPLSQSLAILNTGAGTLNWSASVFTAPPASGWLFVSEASGTVNRPFLDVSSIDVSVDASGLAAGTYYGEVQIRSPGASNSPQVALVILQVLPTGSNPGPDVGPIGLVFTGIAGAGNPSSQSIAIANVTANPINFGSAVAYPGTGNFIQYRPTNATVVPNVPAQIDVQPDFSELSPGPNLAALTLAFDDGSIRTVSILAVVAPSSSSTSSNSRELPRQTSGCKATKLLPEFTLVGYSSNVTAGYPAAVEAKIVDDCGMPLTEGSAIVSFSNGDAELSLISLQDGRWSNSWLPGNASTNVTLTLRANMPAQSLAGITQTASVSQQASQTPPTLSGGPLGAGTQAQGPFAPGDVMLVKGNGLADGQSTAAGTPLQNTLAGASLVIGSKMASLLYADSGQVIGLVPPDIPVNASQQVLLVRDNSYGNPVSVIIAPTHPAILTKDGSGKGQGLAYNAGTGATTLADGTNPAAVGGTIIIYCTGLGTTDSTGRVSNAVTMSIGGQAAQVSYAGLALPLSYPPGGAPMLLGLVSGSLGGLYQVTATVPGGLANGPVTVTISSAGQTSQSGVTLGAAGGGTSTGGAPAITPGGVVAVDSTISTIQAGEFVSIYGTNLGPSSAVTWNGTFVTSLGGTSVTVDGNPAYPIYVSSTLINFQAPNDTAVGPVPVAVTTGAGTTTSTVTLAQFAPSFLLLDNKHVTGIILRGDGSGAYGGGTYDILGPTGSSLGYGTVAAKVGDTVELYALGLGPTSPPIQAGQPFSGASATTNPVNLLINNKSVTPGFAGFSSSLVYQVNMTIPAGLGTGDVPLVATVGGTQTQSGVVISLQ